MAKGVINGVVGHIKWSYYVAAAINGYTVTRDGQQWTLRGTVVVSDAYKLAQRPLIFLAPHSKGVWSWPIEQIEMSRGQVTATLGQPDENNGVVTNSLGA